jgi:hypothetical protein
VAQTWIQASYDPETKRIRGSERLRWRNTSSVPVSDLCFHHYLNAFSSNRSTFMRESGGRLRDDTFDGERWGWIEVASLQLPDGTDLAPLEHYASPDDGNPDDRTVAYYPLPDPLLPGEWVTVDIGFESQLPTIFARTGAQGDYVLAGQWFPKIGVFEDRGDRGRAEPGWNCHQFHAHSEFFADFGDYDVKLTFPQRFAGKIGATGALESETVDGGRVTAHFVQRGVHDFAWTADPGYVVIHDRFDPQRDVPEPERRRFAELLGMEEEAPALPPVEITLLLQPSHRRQKDRYLTAVKAAIRGYGLRLGAYPYRTLTLVDPPFGADGSGGMEYPTFITLGTHVLLEVPPFDRLRFAEIVTVHEFGHQYFQGMLASNEFEESWIDEGINSFYEMSVMEDEYRWAIEFLGARLSPLDLERLDVAGRAFTDPMVTPAWGFLSSWSYRVNSYSRPSLTLRQLENVLGPAVFSRVMRRMFTELRWTHPGSADIERILIRETRRATGRDLTGFLRQALYSSRALDYAVRTVTSRRQEEEKGAFLHDGEPEDGGEDGSGETSGGEGADAPFVSRVVVLRKGEFIHPVTVEMRFEDGTALRREWDGASRWKRWTFTGPSRLVSAQVDPDHQLVLDIDRLNNSRRVEPEPLPRLKALTDLLFFLQTLFSAGHLLA